MLRTFSCIKLPPFSSIYSSRFDMPFDTIILDIHKITIFFIIEFNSLCYGFYSFMKHLFEISTASNIIKEVVKLFRILIEYYQIAINSKYIFILL
jgi:hypothetical protein